MRALVMAAMIAAALGATPGARAQDGPAGQRQIFEDLGNVTDAAEEEGGVWLSLWQPHIRFRIGEEPEAKRNQLVVLINRANQGMRSVAVRYDGTRGRLNRDTGTLDYPVCAITLDDLIFEPTRRCADKPAANPKGAEAALTLARAYLSAGEFRPAQDLLARPGLPGDSAFRRIFLLVRASASENIALTEQPGSPAADRATAAALADYRELARLEPNDVEHQFAIAQALQDLGGYAEADQVADLLLKKWPDEEFRVAVRRGAVHRGRGDYEKALDSLNQLVARQGPQAGMKFYYHRAWTLSLLGRYDEAIADLNEGLRTQPDYSSAYVRRACAFAAVGQLRKAPDDVAEASRLYAAIPGMATMTLIQDDIADLGALRLRLEAGIARGSTTPVQSGCANASWRAMERPRPRSPLLGAR